jgi:hypothetical protein
MHKLTTDRIRRVVDLRSRVVRRCNALLSRPVEVITLLYIGEGTETLFEVTCSWHGACTGYNGNVVDSHVTLPGITAHSLEHNLKHIHHTLLAKQRNITTISEYGALSPMKT